MVLAAIVIARNPSQYGFTLEPAALPAVETVNVSGPVDLRRVAEWAGISVDEVQRLNPELRRWTTPVRSASFPLKLPVGTAALVEQVLATAPPEDLTSLQWHTVRRGETLQAIANKLRVRRTDLAEANYLSAKARVQPGQNLVIPRAPTILLAARTDRSEPVLAPGRSVTPTSPAASVPAAADAGEPAKVIYRVKRGDTLSSIAKFFRTTVAALRSWNRLTSDRLTPGDRLTVYTSRSSARSPRP
jgi:membrane-bound lytic murein transglycosylase D